MMKRVICWLLMLIICLTGCSAGGSEQTAEESKNGQQSESENGQESSQAEESVQESSGDEEPAEGGTLRLAIENPDSLLPWQVTDEATGNLLMLIYSPLMNMAEDGSMQPCLAEEWTWSEDLTEMVIQLRDDVTFHNGKALTAEDVVYSIEKLQSSENVFSDAVADIVHVEALDGGRVLLQFSAPGRMNEEGLIFPIVPENYKKKLVPMGTGPYAWAGSEPMRELQLTRYEGYFGEIPYIPEVTVYFVRDAEAVLQCFETTRTNLMQTDYFEWGSYVNQKNLTIHSFESYEAVYLEFNTSGTFGSVKSNREKVAYALDAVRVLRDAYWGKGEITETPIRPSSWYKQEAAKEYGYNAEKAKNMTAVGSSQVRLLYDHEDPILAVAVETVKQQLEAAGLTVRLVESGRYDIALRRSRMTLMEAAAIVDEAGILAGAKTETEVKAAVTQLEAMMLEELRVYNLFFVTQGTVTGYGIRGSLQAGDWNVYSGVSALFMNEKGGTEP